MPDNTKKQLHEEIDRLRSQVEELQHSSAENESPTNALDQNISAIQFVCSGTPDPMITIDHRGTVVSASESLQAVFGWTTEELVGQNISQLMPEPYRSKHDHFLSEHLRTGRTKLLGQTREFKAIRKNGSVFPCEVTVWRVNAPGREHPLFTGIVRDISERKAAESTKHLLRTRLEAVMSSTLDPLIIIRLDGMIRMASDSVEKVFGWLPQELIGKNVNVLMPEPYHSGHDGYLTHYHETGETNILGETRELEAVRRNGEVFPCELTVWRTDVPNEEKPLFTGIIRDITDRKRIEVAVEESRQWLATTLTSIGDGVIATDLDGIVTFENPIAQKLTGWGKDAIGKPLEEVFRIVNEHTREPVENPVDIVLEKGNVVGLANHTALIAKDGTEYAIADSASPIRDIHGKITGAVLVFRDVTELRSREEAERQLREELAHVARLSTMGEMASGMAHELNQPLTAITTYAAACLQILKSTPEAPQHLTEILEKVSAQAQRAGGIIHRLRRLVRKGDVLSAPFDINEAVNEVVALLNSEVRNNGIRLQVELPEQLVIVRADIIQIEQVILNLIRNAIEAMLETLEDQRLLTIGVSLSENREAIVTVSDQGSGISEEAMNQVFDPFFTTKSHGMGMGLSISRSIIEVHGGKMSVFENSDRGVTFQFTLPTITKDTG